MCFSFWYYIYDDTSSFSSSLKVSMVRDEVEIILLEVSKANTDRWKNAKAFIGNQPGGYKVRESNSLYAIRIYK